MNEDVEDLVTASESPLGPQIHSTAPHLGSDIALRKSVSRYAPTLYPAKRRRRPLAV